MALLEVQELSRKFGGLVAVDRLSFEARAGEVLAIIGPNGAGKTTLFNLLSGLVAADGGRIRFDGRDITHWTPERRCRAGIGRTFQIMQPFEDLSVLENVATGALFGRRPACSVKEALERAAEACERVGLAERVRWRPSNLNPAELKRLELARALATSPRLLLLDEILGGLTPSEHQRAVGLIRSLRDEDGITILLIDHVMKPVRDLADRVLALNFGRAMAEGSFDEVASNPQVIAAYLGGGQEHAGAS